MDREIEEAKRRLAWAEQQYSLAWDELYRAKLGVLQAEDAALKRRDAALHPAGSALRLINLK